MLFLGGEKRLRDNEREIDVLGAFLFEFLIAVILDFFPDGVAIREIDDEALNRAIVH